MMLAGRFFAGFSIGMLVSAPLRIGDIVLTARVFSRPSTSPRLVSPPLIMYTTCLTHSAPVQPRSFGRHIPAVYRYRSLCRRLDRLWVRASSAWHGSGVASTGKYDPSLMYVADL
jgi:hypothetical protein